MIYAKAKKTIMKVSRNSFAASLAFGTFNPLTREIDALYGFFSCFPEKIPERAFIKSIDREVSVKKERKQEEKRAWNLKHSSTPEKNPRSLFGKIQYTEPLEFLCLLKSYYISRINRA